MAIVTPGDLAKRIVERVREEKYNGSMVLIINAIMDRSVSYNGKQIIIGANRQLSYDDFCIIMRYDPPKKGLKNFLKETADELEKLVLEEIEKDPKNVVEAMKNIIVYSDIIEKVSIKNEKYIACQKIFCAINRCRSTDEASMIVAKEINKLIK